MGIALVIFVGLFILVPALVAGWAAVTPVSCSPPSMPCSGWSLHRLPVAHRPVQGDRRVFQYHGAEHMSIHAFEAGEPLSVDSVARYRPEHPRCGTNFLMIVILLSITVFSFVGKPDWPLLVRAASSASR
jgi:hypothetical protein